MAVIDDLKATILGVLCAGTRVRLRLDPATGHGEMMPEVSAAEWCCLLDQELEIMFELGSIITVKIGRHNAEGFSSREGWLQFVQTSKL